MCHTSICIGGNFEWLVFSEPKNMNGVGFGDVRPHLRTKTTPWLPPEVTTDALSQFDAIYLRNKFHFSEVHGSMNATGHVQSK